MRKFEKTSWSPFGNQTVGRVGYVWNLNTIAILLCVFEATGLEEAGRNDVNIYKLCSSSRTA